MSANPLRREGGYWKPVLDYEPWADPKPSSGNSEGARDAAKSGAKSPVRHDLCHHCGSEFVVDSPYCRMCGRGREETVRPATAGFHALHFYQVRRRLGLTTSAMVCLIVGLMCIGAAIVTGFVYSAGTLIDWQAIQIWRGEWLIAAGVAFICGILLNGKNRPVHK